MFASFIVNLSKYKLELNGNYIDELMYNAKASLYFITELYISLNHTNWFICTNGERQGENLSMTLFSIFIDVLGKEINEAYK